MLHDPDEPSLFPRLEGPLLEMLNPLGTVEEHQDGDVLFHEGDQEYQFFVVLDGEVKITKQVGTEETLLTIHRPGEFTGEISMLTGGPAIATGRSLGPSRVLRLDAKAFRQVMAENPQVARVILSAMAARAGDVDAQMRQQEKLAALGKLSAGLAHELNNPAAAAGRAAGQLRESLECFQTLAIQRERPFTPAEQEALEALRHRAHECRRAVPLDPLTQSDREDELTSWLEDQGVEDAWKFAPSLVSAGLDRAEVETLVSGVEPGHLGKAMAWVTSALELTSLIDQIENSTARISDLVKAIKEYSYRDQAPLQEVDLHDGLESTLQILAHKLKGVNIVREYDRNLPRLLVHGSELNQVWTNLIDNAADALQGKGTLTLRTERKRDNAIVQIIDDGPGIPPEAQPRIFDAFFSTKGVGQGTGLGLDIARRIVHTRHKGDLSFESRPGFTCFEVCLPIQPSVRPPSDP